MVLGMNPPKNDYEDFLYFYKDFQRVQKDTGNDYIKWIKNNFNSSNKIYVLGHSLDSNNADILKKIISSYTTKKVNIYYRDDEERGKFLENLHKILSRNKTSDLFDEGFITFIPLYNK